MPGDDPPGDAVGRPLRQSASVQLAPAPNVPVTTDVDSDDLGLLRELSKGEADSNALAEATGRSAETVERRLSALVDEGLVETTDDGAYALTASGHRLLRARPDDPAMEPDVPAAVDLVVSSFDLKVDAGDALRRSAVFVRNWGAVTASEIVDAVYSEAAAGYDDPDEWWDDLVGERLAALPGVVPPDGEDDRWRYVADDWTVDEETDGRRVLDGDEKRYGSVKHAIEREAENDREADLLSTLFEALAVSGRLDDEDVRRFLDAVDDRPVDSDRVVAALAALPGVERDDGEWRYDPADRDRPDDAGG